MLEGEVFLVAKSEAKGTLQELLNSSEIFQSYEFRRYLAADLIEVTTMNIAQNQLIASILSLNAGHYVHSQIRASLTWQPFAGHLLDQSAVLTSSSLDGIPTDRECPRGNGRSQKVTK